MATDFLCGSISGVANCLSGYLFDTLKVKVQMNPEQSMLSILKKYKQNRIFLSLFDGIYYPLITVPLVNAVVFGSYELYKKVTNKTSLSFWDGIENGAFAGFANTLVVSPVQLVKCKMQIYGNKFKNSQECCRYILKNQGIRGLFTGTFATLMRQIPAYSAQFATYQILKDKIINENHKNLTMYEACFVGALAGINCWIFSYPQDIVKTKLQVAEVGKYIKDKYIFDGGFLQCSKQLYSTYGIRGFFIGLKPCLVRAVVANGFGIAAYEKSQQLFASQNQ